MPSFRLNLPRLVLVALILLYIWVFAGLAFAQHAGMRTHKADLGQIDQAVWNSSRGRFLEMTDNGFIATRMTDHVEPVLALVSPILWLWNDVRALLLLQTVAVAIGALPLYALTLLLLDRTLAPTARGQIWEREPLRQLTQPLALALVVAYLFTPQLQSALLTEFHAVPLAVPLILWALWAVEARRWTQFATAVVLVALVKEETALLAAGLAGWAVWRAWISQWSADPLQGVWRITGLGVGLAVMAAAWFYVATFTIVPTHALEVYGVAESSYFRRYGALGDSPVDILRSFFTQPGLVWQIATEPVRLEYLRQLLMPYGWLALLAPEVILLSLPVLLANQLSAYPAQYYGEFHYSAPIVVYFAVASAYGLARLWRGLAQRLNRGSGSFQHLPAANTTTMNLVALVQNSRTALRPLLTLLLGLWIVGWALGSYIATGRGPGGGRYDPTPITAHHQLLGRFTAQIPPDAAVTATAAVHPHVSHRRYVYQFPIGLEPPGIADWALLDVTTATDMAPGDVRDQVEAMLAGEWGVVDGADGFLLLQKGAPDKTIPPAFYSFARTPGDAPNNAPSDAPLTLLTATVDDWPRWRSTEIVTTWQVGAGFDAASMEPAIELRTPSGATLYRWADAMPPALVWVPPQTWQPGDVVTVTTLPLYLPRAFGVTVERTPGLTLAPDLAALDNGRTVLAQAYRRMADGQLITADAAVPSDAEAASPQLYFALDNGASVALSAWLEDTTIHAGELVDLWLRWEGQTWPQGVTAFVHLRQDNTNRAQDDGPPFYFIAQPLDTLSATNDSLWDWRQLAVPEDASAGTWTVVVGLYDPVSGQRVPLVDETGATVGEEAVIATLELAPPPTPDQTCALIPATCASQVAR